MLISVDLDSLVVQIRVSCTACDNNESKALQLFKRSGKEPLRTMESMSMNRLCLVEANRLKDRPFITAKTYIQLPMHSVSSPSISAIVETKPVMYTLSAST